VNDEIHLIRTDILLWILGGFVEPLDEMPGDGSRFLSVAYVRELKRLASKPRCKQGEIKKIANRFGRSHKAAVLMIYRQRHQIDVPRWWQDVA
jgi:hypothetical protein